MVLVTGTSTGIGLACTRLLADEGYCVVAGIRSQHSSPRPRHNAGSVHHLPIDLTSEQDILCACEYVEQLAKKYPLIGMVNNAGVGISGTLEACCSDQLRQVFDVNVFGLLMLTTRMLPILREHRGRILNVGSTSGRIARPGSGVYCASKAALESLTNSLRMELHSSGVKVIMIEPGVVDTPFWQKNPALSSGSNCRMDSVAQKAGASGIPPSLVAHTILKALTVKRPKRRYVVGYDAKKSTLLNCVLPQGVSEFLRYRKLSMSRKH